MCRFEDKYLIAYFDYYDITELDDTVLKIFNIFDGSIVAEIDRAFYSPQLGPETLIFLSDKEIYVDYEPISSVENRETDKRVTNREIICFQQSDNPIVLVRDGM